MADYFPLISRAVAGLENNTGENRRALYERARKALVDQLRGVQPALSETDITRERLALEEAIRKVETEAARQMRQSAPLARARAARVAEQAAPAPVEAAPVEAPQPAEEPVAREVADEPPEQPAPPPGESRPRFERRWIEKKPADSGEGLKGFSDVVADAESLGTAVAKAGRSAREAFTSVPSPSPDFDRIEPRVEAPPAPPEPRPPEQRARAPERPRPAARPPERPRVPARPPEQRPLAPYADLGPVIEDGPETEDTYDARYRSLGTSHGLEGHAAPDALRYVSERARRAQEEKAPPLSRRMIGGLVKTGVVVLVLALVASTVYWQRHNLVSAALKTVSLLRPASAPTPPPARETAPQSAKIPDRIGPPPDAAPQEAPVAQRVVLYEEDPADAAGKRYVGTVVWRSEPSSQSGQPGDRVIRGDITIPERDMKVTWTLGRNFDQSLQFSHTIAIQFTLPPNFDHGEVSEIRGVLMKPAEQVRGTSLAGISVKVKDNFFLIGLNSSEADIQRNVQSLKERPWFDIAVLYRDGRRAILAIEKGTPGERVFNDTFAAWGQ